MQIFQILQKGTRDLKNANVPNPQLEAEILLLQAIGQNRSREWLIANPDYSFNNETMKQFNHFLEKRKRFEPIAYITNEKEFYGYNFYVDHRVLIPRPESEILVEKSVTLLLDPRFREDDIAVLELGTGSGCIIISIIKELQKKFKDFHHDRKQLRFLATDISKDALDVAQENAKIHEVDSSVQFVQSDLFDFLKAKSQKLKADFDLIIANLPYVPSYWLKSSDWAKTLYYEPDIAIDGGSDGLDLYRRFFREVPRYLANDGTILIECENNQIEKILNILKNLNYKFSHQVFRDYNNLRRVMRIGKFKILK